MYLKKRKKKKSHRFQRERQARSLELSSIDAINRDSKQPPVSANVCRACEGNVEEGKVRREWKDEGKKNKGDDTGEGSLSRSTRVSSSRWVKRDP